MHSVEASAHIGELDLNRGDGTFDAADPGALLALLFAYLVQFVSNSAKMLKHRTHLR
jgi:hypothetical protein